MHLNYSTYGSNVSQDPCSIFKKKLLQIVTAGSSPPILDGRRSYIYGTINVKPTRDVFHTRQGGKIIISSFDIFLIEDSFILRNLFSRFCLSFTTKPFPVRCMPFNSSLLLATISLLIKFKHVAKYSLSSSLLNWCYKVR